MTKSFTVYNPTTGQILRTGYIPEGDISSQVGEGEAVLPLSSMPGQDWVVGGRVVPLPNKPLGDYIFDYNTAQWVPDLKKASYDAIQKRNKLLYESDWTQIPNSPLTPEQVEQWAVYRQALRDVPQQEGYPMNIIWPVAP